jgi:hypothetical protein
MTHPRFFTAKNITVGILLAAALVILIGLNVGFLSEIFHFVPSDYPSTNPPIFFSIGEAVAAIAITLTVWQLKKDDWEIAIEVRDSTIPAVCALIAIGFVAEIIASLVTFWKPTNIFELSTLWQLIASLFIIAAPIYIFMGTRKKGLFNPKTKERFVRALLRRVSSRSPAKMDLVADVLLVNMKSMLQEVSSSPLVKGIPEFTRYAHLTLREVVADPAFAAHIVTRRADFFQYFLHRTQKYRGAADTLSVVFNALIKAAFANKNSYFYSELEHTGFGQYKPFLSDVFLNPKIFLNLKPFDQVDFSYGQIVDPERAKLFLVALDLAVKGYWEMDADNYLDFQWSHYHTGFEKLEQLFSRVVEEARQNKQADQWPVSSKLQTISFFVNWDFLHRYDEAIKDGKVSKNDLDASVERKDYAIYPRSMTAGYAELVFNLLAILSGYPVAEARRDFALQLAGDILVFDHRSNLEKIREVLLEYIWEKICGDKFGANIKGYFPAVLPIFLSLTAMWQDGASQQRKDLYNKTVEFLDKELKPKILAGEKMANKEDAMEKVLLPSEVVFDRKRNIFVWHGSLGSTQDMIVRK